MHLADAFFQSDCIQAIHFLGELNSQPFALLTQCSTTEPQEHYILNKMVANIGIIIILFYVRILLHVVFLYTTLSFFYFYVWWWLMLYFGFVLHVIEANLCI